MRRLWVDCDDTLVRWLGEDGQALEGQNPYGGGSERWEANAELVEAIRAWMRANEADDPRLIVWSGGGYDYARVWADRILPGEWHMAVSKDIALPQYEDVCVDDAPIKVRATLYTPADFVASRPADSTQGGEA